MSRLFHFGYWRHFSASSAFAWLEMLPSLLIIGPTAFPSLMRRGTSTTWCTQPARVISVSESFWVLTDEFERIRIVERGTASGDLMVLQQTQRGSLTPPVIPGYRLLSQRFISHPPKWFGLPIARTMPGYSFAVFARKRSKSKFSGLAKMHNPSLPSGHLCPRRWELTASGCPFP